MRSSKDFPLSFGQAVHIDSVVRGLLTDRCIGSELNELDRFCTLSKSRQNCSQFVARGRIDGIVQTILIDIDAFDRYSGTFDGSTDTVVRVGFYPIDGRRAVRELGTDRIVFGRDVAFRREQIYSLPGVIDRSRKQLNVVSIDFE
ncbi:hypothetical protein RBH26_06685 [Natronolimnohabitans sp. A-GB9]|uniref:hypothetical protein n=1 Tax=Natronolimnohabitans sp. A-GB9 TaxID=3069757 RepID=UPI0027ADB630|nr:hypothetical protein [Natronolimnohabitans sp. A-GB9]MDQ2050168.1 hypothetical protein [Natronolimnohabitans sp. A-GB9]